MKGVSVVELLLIINFPFVSFFYVTHIQSLSILSYSCRFSGHFAAGGSICFTDLLHINFLRYSFLIGTFKPFSLRRSSKNFEIPVCHILPISAHT